VGAQGFENPLVKLRSWGLTAEAGVGRPLIITDAGGANCLELSAGSNRVLATGSGIQIRPFQRKLQAYEKSIGRNWEAELLTAEVDWGWTNWKVPFPAYESNGPIVNAAWRKNALELAVTRIWFQLLQRVGLLAYRNWRNWTFVPPSCNASNGFQS
jgi:hypothetical protein